MNRSNQAKSNAKNSSKPKNTKGKKAPQASMRKYPQAPKLQRAIAQRPRLGPITMQYLKSLTDPFENQGVPLGFDCLVPTRISTAYIRGTASSDADGTLSLAVVPNATALVWSWSTGSAGTVTAVTNATDQAAITSNFGSGRVISLGIKAYPNLAATSVPGQVSAGAIPGSNYTLLAALTPADFASFPTSHIGRGYEGGVACGRPQDITSFEFYPQLVNGTGFAGTVPFPSSIPYITFTGIGSGTTVYYEVILNFEAVEILQHASAAVGMGDLDSSIRTLSSEWMSKESMWIGVRNQLPDPGRAGYDVLSGTSTTIQNNMSNGGRMTFGGQMRSRLGN